MGIRLVDFASKQLSRITELQWATEKRINQCEYERDTKVIKIEWQGNHHSSVSMWDANEIGKHEMLLIMCKNYMIFTV